MPLVSGGGRDRICRPDLFLSDPLLVLLACHDNLHMEVVVAHPKGSYQAAAAAFKEHSTKKYVNFQIQYVQQEKEEVDPDQHQPPTKPPVIDELLRKAAKECRKLTGPGYCTLCFSSERHCVRGSASA